LPTLTRPAAAPKIGFRSASDDGPLISKLSTIIDLGDEDKAELRNMCVDARNLPPRRNIIREGDRPDHVHLVVEGWAARYKLLPDGARQITAFLLPGDFCDLHITILNEMDHSIATLTRAKVAFIPRARMDAITDRAGIAKAFWWATLVDEAVLRAWIVNIGRREAVEAVGHLLCELYCRMKLVGLTTDHQFELPLTQEELGDALGLTAVHINRVLQRLRADKLIALESGALKILDYQGLEALAGFNPNYLHLAHRQEN